MSASSELNQVGQRVHQADAVRNGDLNILGQFIAFASPMDVTYIQENTPPGGDVPQYSPSQSRMLAGAFKQVRDKFTRENVGLVVRLNNELYDRDHFTQMGIDHG
jgi:cell division cycle 14